MNFGLRTRKVRYNSLLWSSAFLACSGRSDCAAQNDTKRNETKLNATERDETNEQHSIEMCLCVQEFASS